MRELMLLFPVVAVLDGYLYIIGGEISQFIDGEADSVRSRAGKPNRKPRRVAVAAAWCSVLPPSLPRPSQHKL